MRSRVTDFVLFWYQRKADMHLHISEFTLNYITKWPSIVLADIISFESGLSK